MKSIKEEYQEKMREV
jgi:hypothetical protein